VEKTGGAVAPALTLAPIACSLSGAMSILVRRVGLSRPFSLAAFSALCLIGCLPQEGDTGSSGSSGSSSSGSSGSSSSDGGVTVAGQACLDTAAAFATAAKRCGGNYDAERAAFIRDLARGDCNAVTIRNETELRTMCFPAIAKISCTDLKEQRLAPSCAEQIIRPL